MSRTASRTLVAALAAVFVLAAAEPALAQKAKARSGGKSGASSSQVKRVAPPQARPSSSSRSVKAAPSSSARSAPSSARTTVRVNRAPAPQSRPSTTVRVNRAPAPQERTTVRVNRAPTPQERATTTLRINRAPAPESRTKATLKSLYTRKTPPADPNGRNRDVVRDVQKKKISDQFTQPRDNSGNRGNDNVNRRNDGRRQPYAPRNRGVNTGYRRGYDRGYYDGWHNRYVRRYHYRHYHYYGPRRVWGFHYGGFGFYHGYWHFAIVIGGPVIVYRNYCGYYNYCWWDGRGASLVTWSAAVQTYPASYTFEEGSCVELWIRTTAGEDYAVKVDPRYWNAADPGDLYAALWAQLDQEGQLQLEDVNGVLHVFSAGQIQQIEARACH